MQHIIAAAWPQREEAKLTGVSSGAARRGVRCALARRMSPSCMPAARCHRIVSDSSSLPNRRRCARLCSRPGGPLWRRAAAPLALLASSSHFPLRVLPGVVELRSGLGRGAARQSVTNSSTPPAALDPAHYRGDTKLSSPIHHPFLAGQAVGMSRIELI